VANFKFRPLYPGEIIAVPIEWSREQFWAFLREEKFVFSGIYFSFRKFLGPLLDFPWERGSAVG
jgi:hypothetical protein